MSQCRQQLNNFSAPDANYPTVSKLSDAVSNTGDPDDLSVRKWAINSDKLCDFWCKYDSQKKLLVTEWNVCKVNRQTNKQ